MSSDAQNECLKQARRLERMNQDSSEATLTRTYLEWMIDLPWTRVSEAKLKCRIVNKFSMKIIMVLKKLKIVFWNI